MGVEEIEPSQPTKIIFMLPRFLIFFEALLKP